MQYDTIMGMLFYEFQNVLETYSNILKDRKEAEEKEQSEKGLDVSNYTPERILKNAQGYMSNPSKLTNMPNINIPKF
jgi:hypothetical protein